MSQAFREDKAGDRGNDLKDAPIHCIFQREADEPRRVLSSLKQESIWDPQAPLVHRQRCRIYA